MLKMGLQCEPQDVKILNRGNGHEVRVSCELLGCAKGQVAPQVARQFKVRG